MPDENRPTSPRDPASAAAPPPGARLLPALGALIVVLALAALLVYARAGGDVGAPGRPAGERPNIVFILADDQSVHTFDRELMPNVFAEIVDPGLRLDEAIAAPPLCCPYRAGVLTGQYPQNHGVSTNDPGYRLLEDKENVLPVWLSRAGYTTALVGKYLNGYRSSVGGPEVAPGWDEWFEVEVGVEYFDPVIDDGGTRSEPGGYVSDVLNRHASEFISAQADSPDPFFLWLSEFAPHASQDAAPASSCPPSTAQSPAADFAAYDGPGFAEVRRASFDEGDVTDKPPKIAERERFTPAVKREIALRYRCAAVAVEQMDEGIGEVMDTLRETGQLDDTIVIYGSDNGYFFGEHRDRKGKAAIYEEALNVPLAIRVPPGFAGAEMDPNAGGELIAQQDLTAAFLDWAGAEPCAAEGECRTLDGRSAIELLERGDWGGDRAIPYELYPRCPRREEGLRTLGYAYVRAGSGPKCEGVDAEQLYDLRRDPFELDNLAGEPAYAELRERLDLATESLTRCAGIEGRDERSGDRPFCD